MRPYRTSNGRRGTITVIVVSFLVLLFVLALTFVFYSTAESDTARVYRDYANINKSDDSGGPDPSEIFNTTLGQLIYGVPDDETGAFNGLRTHDLARLVYGKAKTFETGPFPEPDQAYNGVGRVPLVAVHPWMPPEAANMVNFTWHSTASFPGSPAEPMLKGGVFDPDNTYLRNPQTKLPAFDPATYRYWAKNANYTIPDSNNLFLAKLDPTSGRVMVPSLHRPWLMKDPTGATIYPPPPYATDPGYPNALPTPITGLPATPVAGDPNPWTNMWGRLLTLRPRPVDHQWPVGSGISYFPYPTLNINAATGLPLTNPDGTVSYGDVQNMDGLPGGKFYDSIWIDPDLPVRKWQGKNYKPLVAFLVLDMDSRINLNTAGNFYQLPLPAGSPPQYSHASHQGVGPWEVNPAQVLADYQPRPIPAPPGFNYFDINGAAMLTRRPFVNPPAPYAWGAPAASNRYGGDGSPISTAFGGFPIKKFNGHANETGNVPADPSGALLLGRSPNHFYGQVDFNGGSPTLNPFKVSDQSNGRQTNLVFGRPYVGSPAGPPPNFPRPDPESPFDNGQVVVGAYDERSNHPSLYNPYLLGSVGNTNTTAPVNRTFGVEELRYLNTKYNPTAVADLAGSDLANLAPASLGKADYLVGEKNARFLATVLSSDFNKPGASPWLGAPAANSFQLSLLQPGETPRGTPMPFAPSPAGTPAPSGGDHDAAYRAALAVLGSVDINRKLTDYRARVDQPYSRDNLGNFQRADQDRQRLAQDVFDRLLMVTMGKVSGNIAVAPGTPIATGLSPAGTPANRTERWLAQLAVNMVDFLDGDDIMTGFVWNPAGATPDQKYVYGFERPKLVMNETYIRYESVPMAQTEIDMTTMNRKPAIDPATMQRFPHKMRVWIELHNPVTPMSPAEQALDPMGFDGTQGGYRARLVETKAAVATPGPAEISAYQILPYKVPIGPGTDKLKLQAPNAESYDNPTGTPVVAAGPPAPGTVSRLLNATTGQHAIQFTASADVVLAGGSTKVIEPNIGADIGGPANRSFYVLGSKLDNDDPTTAPPGLVANMSHAHLDYDLTETEVAPGTYMATWAPAFVMQRLANPYLPADVTGPGTNPYVTVDYLDADPTGQSVYDHAEFQFDAMRDMNSRPDWNTTFAWGRRQPYDARVDYTQAAQFRQGTGMAGMGSIGGQTFTRHNAKNGTWPASAGPGTATDQSPGTLTAGGNETLQVPFLPLAHFDRPAVSPADLLHVVAVKPHELTHLYHMIPPAQAPAGVRKLAFTADWLDEAVPTGTGRSSFLFRALDYLRTPRPFVGTSNGGRIAGKVNVNTMTIPDTLFAIADPKRVLDGYDPRTSQNRFTETDVQTAWNTLMGWGGGVMGRDAVPGGVSEQDRPFKGLATDVGVAGQAPGTNSMDRTILRRGALYGSGVEDFTDGPGGTAGAYQKYEMLGKTLNNFTTRSNAFAVYMTIGYFEVMNEGPYTEAWRPILGKEMGTDEGNIVRHKFFAVVDRTNLTREYENGALNGKQGQAAIYLPYEPEVSLPDPAVYPDPDLPTLTAPSPIPVRTGFPLTNAAVMVRIPANGQSPGPMLPLNPNHWT
ncbi:MAG TPA: hypothetical protein VM597_35175, partial [Gemmataceae bacterium]|nr:hypothetical protein [Gemmataceae bacterium]